MLSVMDSEMRVEDMGRVIDDLLTDRSILLTGHDDEDLAYTTVDFANNCSFINNRGLVRPPTKGFRPPCRRRGCVSRD